MLPTTPYYPGLEGATSALMTLTGISSYGAGTILVGAARLDLHGRALLPLRPRVSGSAGGAGLGVAIYTGSCNFLFWGAQFSYESLALPLLVVVLMAFAEREASRRRRCAAWAVPIVLGILAIVDHPPPHLLRAGGDLRRRSPSLYRVDEGRRSRTRGRSRCLRSRSPPSAGC